LRFAPVVQRRSCATFRKQSGWVPAMKSPLRLSALFVVVALGCSGFAPRVRSAVPAGLPATQERIVTSEPATATIPGPLRSFERIAGISQKAAPEEVMPLLARNVFLIGYQGSGLGSRATEFLILLRRYVQQARELSDLAGKDGVIRVSWLRRCQTTARHPGLQAHGGLRKSHHVRNDVRSAQSFSYD